MGNQRPSVFLEGQLKEFVNGTPRMRGDDPLNQALRHANAECSPHTRG